MNAEDMLERILTVKRKEVEQQKELYPVALLEKSIYFQTPVCSLREYLKRSDLSAVIAEIKRKSPSKGVFHPSVNVAALSLGYMQAGASALSIVTDKEFFGGSLDDLRVARKNNFCPILRKDFIIHEYQIIEARSAGADAILLIRDCLADKEIASLSQKAAQLGMEVLLEIHREDELQGVPWENIHVLGVNNRNLRDFSVDIERAIQIFHKLPHNIPAIAESGIQNIQDMERLWKTGYRGFLIGEAFLREAHPARACEQLLSAWRERLPELRAEGAGA